METKKPKLIIVEGIDRVGKTTLCSRLSERYGIKHYHDSYKQPYDKDYNNRIIDMKFNTMIQMMLFYNEDLIVDRFHMSEYVYDRVRGLKFQNYKTIESYLTSLFDCILILVNSEHIERSIEEHGDDLLLHDKLFKEMYAQSTIQKKIWTSYSHFSDTELVVYNMLAL